MISCAFQDRPELCCWPNYDLTLVNSYNGPETKTAKFKKMFEALKNKDYIEAGLQMEDSLWAKKHTPARASRLAEKMKKLT